VLVGVGTVLADDPLLTVRLARGRTPLRVVLDSTLRTPREARILASTDESPVVIATTSREKSRIREVEARGVSVWVFEPAADGRVPLAPLLRRLAGEGRFAVLVEGGAAVHTSFLREGLADRIAVGIAPMILGGAGPSSLAGDLGRSRLSEAIALEGLEVRRLGRDLWIEGTIARNGATHV
jgi:diaminohydroxyphosphoribosylaminopyrimidine deaminase/5-amino-6-(5-phosphoribosylamino)uracil reductase